MKPEPVTPSADQPLFPDVVEPLPNAKASGPLGCLPLVERPSQLPDAVILPGKSGVVGKVQLTMPAGVKSP